MNWTNATWIWITTWQPGVPGTKRSKKHYPQSKRQSEAMTKEDEPTRVEFLTRKSSFVVFHRRSAAICEISAFTMADNLNEWPKKPNKFEYLFRQDFEVWMTIRYICINSINWSGNYRLKLRMHAYDVNKNKTQEKSEWCGQCTLAEKKQEAMSNCQTKCDLFIVDCLHEINHENCFSGMVYLQCHKFSNCPPPLLKMPSASAESITEDDGNLIRRFTVYVAKLNDRGITVSNWVFLLKSKQLLNKMC